MTRAYVAFVVLCLVFGTTFGAISIGIANGWPPFLAAGVRFALAGAIVLGFAAMRGELRRVTAREVRDIAAIGLTVTAGTFGALYSAEAILPSGLAAVLSATSPLFAVGLAVFAKRRRFDLGVAAGIALGTLGVVLVAGVGGARDARSEFAAVAIVVSEIGFAWGLSQMRAVASRVPMLELAGAQQLVGGAVLLAISLAFERRGVAHASLAGLLALGYLAIVASAFAHTLLSWLATRTTAVFATSWSYVSPFIALFFGACSLHEPLGIVAWCGGACVVAAAVVLNRDVRTMCVGPVACDAATPKRNLRIG